jgi:hypothetical protein
MKDENEDKKLGEAGDPVKVERQREKGKRRDAVDALHFKRQMSTPQGRAFVALMLKQCRVGQVAFVEGSARTTDFILGHQNVGHWLLAQLREHCLPLVRLMEDEERSSE